MKDDVRKQADWLTQADERILELMIDQGTHPPSPIGHMLNDICEGIDYNRSYISQRCRVLAEYGLLSKEYKNYSLSEKGRAYLEGELDAQELEKQEIDRPYE